MLRLPIVISLLVKLQGFPTVCSFLWSSSSCCYPGPVEASDLTSHPCFSPCCCRNEEVVFCFFFNVCWGDATKSKLAAEILTNHPNCVKSFWATVSVSHWMKTESLFFTFTLAVKSPKAVRVHVSLLVCSACCTGSKCQIDIGLVFAVISFGCTLQLSR